MIRSGRNVKLSVYRIISSPSFQLEQEIGWVHSAGSHGSSCNEIQQQPKISWGFFLSKGKTSKETSLISQRDKLRPLGPT